MNDNNFDWHAYLGLVNQRNNTTPSSSHERTKHKHANTESGIVACVKCKSRQVTFFTKQTRRGDEGHTVFFSCMACKHVWCEE